MQLFIDAGFWGQDVFLLNLVQMHLQIVSLSGMMTPDGRAVTHQSFLLFYSNGLWCHFDWPQSPPISPHLLELWQSALKVTLFLPNAAVSSRRLRYDLWLNQWTIHSVQHNWLWFYSRDEDRLYHRLPQDWEIWSAFSGRGAWGRYCL